MRKIFLIIFIFALLAPALALAVEEDEPPARAYYSEPIGAGEKVFHITVCAKTRSYAPLYCNEQTKKLSDKQCVEKKKNTKTGKEEQKVKDVPIKGCKTNGIIVDTTYPEVDVKKYDQTDGKCEPGAKEVDPSASDYFYAPQFAIVGQETQDVKAIIASKEKPSGDAIASALGIKKEEFQTDDYESKEFYQTTLCSTYDVVLKKDGSISKVEDITKLEVSDEKGSLTEQVKAIQEAAKKFKNWQEENCNIDNSESAVGGFAQSTPFDSNQTFTCSIVERITGTSGSDILGKYLSGIYRWAAGVVGIVSVLVIVMNGIRISMAGGDSAAIDNAKHRIMQSIIGLVILFLSGLILYTINSTFFTGG